MGRRVASSEPIERERIESPLEAWGTRAPSRLALVDADRSWSYGELLAQSRTFAEELIRQGVEPGDRVAIHLDKVAESVAALYGTWLAGGVAVPINETLQPRQIRHIVANSGARVFVSQPRQLARLPADTVGDARVVAVSRQEAEPHDMDPRVRCGGDTPAAILYTSGSTGAPKGILISHANLAAGARIVSHYLEIRADERILSVLPFSFDYGLNQLITSVRCGATLVLQRSHLPADVCRALVRHAITALAAVPPLWLQLLQAHSPLRQMASDIRLRYMTNSGGVFPAELVRQYRELWPDTRLYLMYGLSEAFRSTYLPPDQLERRPGSMGRAIPETEIHVLAVDGHECEPGEVGELVHRGPTVALGYWHDEAATQVVFRPSPFAGSAPGERVVFSGDLVKRDTDGYLYFVGRRDQLIKSLGYRISPDEVEEIIYGSGLAAEVVVRARPDPIAGQVIVAHVVPRDGGAFSTDALLSYCQREMPRYMVPRHVEVHVSLPRTASGKIDRQGIVT